jgi:hypothetical protein
VEGGGVYGGKIDDNLKSYEGELRILDAEKDTEY